MGRKNRRMNERTDKKFDKFLKSFAAEQQELEHKKEQKVIQKKMITTNEYKNYKEHIKKRNKEQDKKRLEYAIQQLELNNIEYHILNEENAFIECRKLNTNMWIKYFASSGYIMGFRDFRGIKTLIELLTTEV